MCPVDRNSSVELGAEVFAAQDVVARAPECVCEAPLNTAKSPNLGSELGQLGLGEALPAGLTAGSEQASDLLEAEARSLTEHDDGQTLDGVGVVLAAQSSALDAPDEPMTLVVVERGGG
jgi:hypothetical protein